MTIPKGTLIVAILLPLLFAGFGAASAAPSCEKVAVGAIRWDAWHGDDTSIGKAVERSLGQEKWKDRWPTFQTNESDGIEFNEARPEIVEEEMRLAQDAGIDYWAFMFYGRQSPMGRVLEQYLRSSAQGPKFALVVQVGRLLTAGAAEIASDMQSLTNHPRYLKTRDGRPLIFMYVADPKLKLETVLPAFKRLAANAKAGGTAAPRFVVMSFSTDQARAIAAAADSNDISTYASHGSARGGAYRELASGAEKLWDRQASTGANVVPIIMSGWDPRPRIERPTGFDSGYPGGAYYLSPTPMELATHLDNGIKWVLRHPDGPCTVIIYAWNEYDEGGWIAPTSIEGGARLEAVRQAVANNR